MNIATVVLTAPRPSETLRRTLRSLRAAGWACTDGPSSGVGVYDDAASSGHFRAYMEALRYAVQRDPEADAYFIVEDDVTILELSEWYARGNPSTRKIAEIRGA